MKRFVTYIYEYERGVRGRSVGFVRTDLRDDNCRMEVHIRGLERLNGKYPVYLTAADNGMVGMPAAELVLTHGCGNCGFLCVNNRIGDYHIRQVQTLTIVCGNGRFLIGCLSAAPAPDAVTGNFRIWKPQMQAAQAPMETPAEQKPQALVQEYEAAADTGTAPDTDADTNTNTDADTNTNTNTNTDTDTDTDADTDNDTQAEPSEADSTSKPADYKRIEITDIRRLPKRNWGLCSNRFLVHGFFNYHYLLLKTTKTGGETKQYIGVPGVYEQPERMMALLFGFPEFESAETHLCSAQALPEDDTGTFGYWMCPVY